MIYTITFSITHDDAVLDGDKAVLLERRDDARVELGDTARALGNVTQDLGAALPERPLEPALFAQRLEPLPA